VSFDSVATLQQVCQELDQLILDVTERPQRRPPMMDTRDMFSGKKRPYPEEYHHRQLK